MPVKRPVAGVAMGLILTQDGRHRILKDILGSEDALGDMDFKVAGDAEGITAFQMDIKVQEDPPPAKRWSVQPTTMPLPSSLVLPGTPKH